MLPQFCWTLFRYVVVLAALVWPSLRLQAGDRQLFDELGTKLRVAVKGERLKEVEALVDELLVVSKRIDIRPPKALTLYREAWAEYLMAASYRYSGQDRHLEGITVAKKALKIRDFSPIPK